MMTKRNGSVLDLDQFEKELMALVSDLRVDEKFNEDPESRQVAYVATAKRLGFL